MLPNFRFLLAAAFATLALAIGVTGVLSTLRVARDPAIAPRAIAAQSMGDRWDWQDLYRPAAMQPDAKKSVALSAAQQTDTPSIWGPASPSVVPTEAPDANPTADIAPASKSSEAAAETGAAAHDRNTADAPANTKVATQATESQVVEPQVVEPQTTADQTAAPEIITPPASRNTPLLAAQNAAPAQRAEPCAPAIHVDVHSITESVAAMEKVASLTTDAGNQIITATEARAATVPATTAPVVDPAAIVPAAAEPVAAVQAASVPTASLARAETPDAKAAAQSGTRETSQSDITNAIAGDAKNKPDADGTPAAEGAANAGSGAGPQSGQIAKPSSGSLAILNPEPEMATQPGALSSPSADHATPLPSPRPKVVVKKIRKAKVAARPRQRVAAARRAHIRRAPVASRPRAQQQQPFGLFGPAPELETGAQGQTGARSPNP